VCSAVVCADETGLVRRSGLWVVHHALVEADLRTGRLVLRGFTGTDLDELVALDADPQVMYFITGGLPTPPEEIEHDVLPAFLTYHERSAHRGYWAAEDAATGQFLGWFHLRPAPGRGDEEPELGYRLRRSAWGHGYATEGARALIDHAFRQRGVQRVLAETMVVHTASRRVLEKCGMRVLRTFRADWPFPIPGDEHGDVEYVLDRADWERRRQILTPP
jgi:RimJ/RimL family protein N-acetyltransferase